MARDNGRMGVIQKPAHTRPKLPAGNFQESSVLGKCSLGTLMYGEQNTVSCKDTLRRSQKIARVPPKGGR